MAQSVRTFYQERRNGDRWQTFCLILDHSLYRRFIERMGIMADLLFDTGEQSLHSFYGEKGNGGRASI